MKATNVGEMVVSFVGGLMVLFILFLFNEVGFFVSTIMERLTLSFIMFMGSLNYFSSKTS